ncbi:hypothetical protein H310_03944 [Aphanomyces invadans]|uniref:Uncharacterized protein n=1 Tax=Aphanomyces invadans TaxID=157072 RepID=A0A024UG07_9STRA|nr:hypothetical protein H310_03944 [Aphanomyces invadans]ETW04812.1 hypothetical protein H310_03944 [Aphanomyces invadans]|eukprot:XP_008866250.1 hypothetical protein H310_03944 [Aphanomyces invadans]
MVPLVVLAIDRRLSIETARHIVPMGWATSSDALDLMLMEEYVRRSWGRESAVPRNGRTVRRLPSRCYNGIHGHHEKACVTVAVTSLSSFGEKHVDMGRARQSRRRMFGIDARRWCLGE